MPRIEHRSSIVVLLCSKGERIRRERSSSRLKCRGKTTRIQLQNTRPGQRAVSEVVSRPSTEPGGARQLPPTLSLTPHRTGQLGPGQGVGIRAAELSTTLQRITKEEVTFKERTPRSWQKDTKGATNRSKERTTPGILMQLLYNTPKEETNPQPPHRASRAQLWARLLQPELPHLTPWAPATRG